VSHKLAVDMLVQILNNRQTGRRLEGQYYGQTKNTGREKIDFRNTIRCRLFGTSKHCVTCTNRTHKEGNITDRQTDIYKWNSVSRQKTLCDVLLADCRMPM